MTLVDIGYRALDGAETDTRSPPPVRLLAAWVHAARVTGILLAGGADPAQLTERLQHWVPFPHRDIYAAAGQPFQDLAWPWNVHACDLRFVGLGAILGRHRELAAQLDLPAVRTRLDRLLSGHPDPMTDMDLLHDPYLLSNRLGCFWGGDRAHALAALVEPDLANRFSPAAFTNYIDDLLANLTQTPDDPNRWFLLWQHVGPGRLEPDPARRLDAILAGLDLDASFQRDPMVLTPLMELAVRHASDRGRIEAIINRWAEGIDSGTYPLPGFVKQVGDKARDTFIDRLIHWMHGLATRHPEDPDAEFARLLDGLALRSRTIAAYLRGPLTNIARRLPFARHRTLRRSLLCVRSRPEPSGDGSGTPSVGMGKNRARVPRKKTNTRRS